MSFGVGAHCRSLRSGRDDKFRRANLRWVLLVEWRVGVEKGVDGTFTNHCSISISLSPNIR